MSSQCYVLDIEANIYCKTETTQWDASHHFQIRKVSSWDIAHIFSQRGLMLNVAILYEVVHLYKHLDSFLWSTRQ